MMLDEELEYQEFAKTQEGVFQKAFNFGRNYRDFDDVSVDDYTEFIKESVAELVDVTNLSAEDAESLIQEKIDEGFELESAVAFA